MAVNKNFVVKNGLEVNSDLIIADSSNKRVGIGSTIPGYTLEVIGGIGATDIYLSGLSTFVGFSTFQDSIGVQNDITIAGISTVVGVATFRDDVYIDGNLNVAGDIVYDEVNGRNIYISGLSTFVGVSTFQSAVGFRTDVFISGMSTVVGVATFRDNVFIDGTATVKGDLNVTGDISYDQVTGREIYISGLSTFVGVSTHESTLFTKDLYVTGVSTFAGAIQGASDLYVSSNTGIGTETPDTAAHAANTKILNVGVVTANYIYAKSIDGSATIGLSSEGTYIGAGVSLLNLASSNSTAWTISDPSSGVATATVTPGVSLGLAIALGG